MSNEKIDKSPENASVNHGFVLLHRRVFVNPVFASDMEALRFCWLFAKASWKDGRRVRYKNRLIELNRGQLAISLRDLSRKWEISTKRARDFLKRLEKDTMIETQTGTGVTLITIVNYDEYQVPIENLKQSESHPRAQEGHSEGTQNKENNKLKINSKNNTPGEPATKGYLFEGTVVKLTADDFNAWCRSFAKGNAALLRAWLQERDDWLTYEATDQHRKRWFHSTSSWLRRKAADHATAEDREGRYQARSFTGNDLADAAARGELKGTYRR